LKSKTCTVINDKSKGSVATHLRCGELFYQFTVDLSISLVLKEFLKSVTTSESHQTGNKVDLTISCTMSCLNMQNSPDNLSMMDRICITLWLIISTLLQIY